MTDQLNRWPSTFEGWTGASKPPDIDESYTRGFTWPAKNGANASNRRITADIPVDVYTYCTNRSRVHDYGVYLADPIQRPFVESFAGRFVDSLPDKAASAEERLDAAVRFVQSLEYTRDPEDTGHAVYPKYPVETVVHKRGDCEDKTLLLGAILEELGYEVAVLALPNARHMLLGVSLDRCRGTSVKSDGTTYYPVETTALGWDVGELPRKYRDTEVEVHRSLNQPILVHEWNIALIGRDQFDVSLHVANFGNGEAENVDGQFRFQRRDGEVETGVTLIRDASLSPGESIQRRREIRLQTDREIRPRFLLTIDRVIHDESTGAWRG